MVTYQNKLLGNQIFCKFIDVGAKYTILFSHGNADTLYLAQVLLLYKNNKMWITKSFMI